MPLNITFQVDDRRYHQARIISRYPSVSARFNRHYESPQDADSILVTGVINESKASQSTVYSGRFVGEKYKEDVNGIVLKISDTIQEAEAEALRYKEMQELQGSAIPRFYGLFRVEVSCGGHLAGIVLERFGEPVDKLPEDLEHGVQARILHYMDKIHKAGVLLDDLGSGNILFDGEDIRIIDFTSTLPHQCTSKYDYLNAPEVVDENEVVPAMKCRNLYSLASEMGFWKFPQVVINGFPYNVKGMPTNPEVIKMLNPERFFTVYSSYQLITLLKVYYQNVYKKLESGKPAEELQQDMKQIMGEAEEEWKAKFPAAQYGYGGGTRPEYSKQQSNNLKVLTGA